MSQEAKKRLEKLANKHTEPRDLATLLIEYLRLTADDATHKHAVVERALTSWSNDRRNSAASDLASKNRYVHDQLGAVMDTLERLRDEMEDDAQ